MKIKNTYLQMNHRFIEQIKRLCIQYHMKGSYGGLLPLEGFVRLLDGLTNEINNLQKQNDELTTLNKKPDYYKHFKGGIYELIDYATSFDNLDELVIYKDDKGKIWTRTKSQFFSTVASKDEGVVPRFEKINK